MNPVGSKGPDQHVLYSQPPLPGHKISFVQMIDYLIDYQSFLPHVTDGQKELSVN